MVSFTLSPQSPLRLCRSLESYGHLRIFLLEKRRISKQNHIRDLEPTEK
jgi:hypothetical protein